MMRHLFVILFLLSTTCSMAQSSTVNSVGMYSKLSFGIEEFSDIFKNKVTSDHYRVGANFSFHLTRTTANKLYYSVTAGYTKYNTYTFQKTEYDEYSFPFELHLGYEVFGIKNSVFVDVNAHVGYQRFLQYYQPENQFSNRKKASNSMGYGVGIGINSPGIKNPVVGSVNKCFLMYSSYGEQRFFSCGIFFFIPSNDT